MGIVAMFLIGISGCGEKHLNVSTSSGKANNQEELEASLKGTPPEQTVIQDSSLFESGLGSKLASQSSTGQETAMVVEPPPLPTIRGESAKESLGTSETAGASIPAESGEGIQRHLPSGATEEIPTPSTYQTALERNVEPSGSGMEPILEPSGSGDGAPLVPFSTSETDQAAQSRGSSAEEEFDALVHATQNQGELMGASHVERVPENIVVAKVQPSDAVDEQLARIKDDELATATAGLQDVFFEFDSWKITEEGKDMLDKNANLLQEEPAMNLLIEGHCDQRGTQAYNIVLGKKRAIAIRDYLVQLGIEPARLSVITYGKEKPFCTDHTDFCFKENRRGHFIVQKP
jgi:peptidoglycan-associated lipoprotein